MCNNVLVVDTKGRCIFCYDPANDDAPPSQTSTSTGSSSRSSSGFEKLQNYLDVSNNRLYRRSSQFLLNIGGQDDFGIKADERIRVEVTFCHTCSLIMERFNATYVYVKCEEAIYRQLSKCVRSVYLAIKHTDESSSRVNEYMEHVKSSASDYLTSDDLFLANFAANLRTEIYEKCFLKSVIPNCDTGGNLPNSMSNVEMPAASDSSDSTSSVSTDSD